MNNWTEKFRLPTKWKQEWEEMKQMINDNPGRYTIIRRKEYRDNGKVTKTITGSGYFWSTELWRKDGNFIYSIEIPQPIDTAKILRILKNEL